MELFFRLASPLTLANFIADIDQADTITIDEYRWLRDASVRALRANVGRDEANVMLKSIGANRL